MFSLANGNASGNKPISKFRSQLIRGHWVVVTRGGLRHSIPVLIRCRNVRRSELLWSAVNGGVA